MKKKYHCRWPMSETTMNVANVEAQTNLYLGISSLLPVTAPIFVDRAVLSSLHPERLKRRRGSA